MNKPEFPPLQVMCSGCRQTWSEGQPSKCKCLPPWVVILAIGIFYFSLTIAMVVKLWGMN